MFDEIASWLYKLIAQSYLKSKKINMIIGIPRERKTLEKRVAVTPDGARELVESGHQILIEKEAGLGSFYADRDYLDAGCKIVDTLKEVWEAELVVKVKEPDKEEFQYLREGLILFDYLHLSGLPDVAEQLLHSKVTGIAYESVAVEQSLPLLEPMSEVAGRLATQLGAHYLLTQMGGRGTLLGGTENVTGGIVTVIGAGIAGSAAIDVACGMGAKVNVLDINQERLDRLKALYPDSVTTFLSNPDTIAEIAPQTDLMILAVLVPGAKAPLVLRREHVEKMPEGSVLIDIAIDQGGAAETIKPTSLKEPVYVDSGVIHYAVPNMPSQVARTSTKALTRVTLPYIKLIADHGLASATAQSAELASAVNTFQGNVTNQEVAKSLAKDYQDFKEL